MESDFPSIKGRHTWQNDNMCMLFGYRIKPHRYLSSLRRVKLISSFWINMLTGKLKSIEEWERLERIKSKLSAKLDACLKQLETETSQERIKGLKTLRRILAMLSEEERGMFVIFHSDRNCDVQRQLFDMIKKRKSPKYGIII